MTSVKVNNVEITYEKLFDKFIELLTHNSVDSLEYVEDFKDMRETQEMLLHNRDFSIYYYKILNSFMFSNGLYHRLNNVFLSDEVLSFLSLFTFEQYQPKNRYLQYYLKYYYENINEDMKELYSRFYDNEFILNDYRRVPGIAAGLSKIDLIPYKNKSNNIIAHNNKFGNNINNIIQKCIKVGSCLQFNVEGFAKNQFLYLLFGVCVCDAYSRMNDFKTFRSLINFLITYIRLNLVSKCYDGSAFCETSEGFNLITFIDFYVDGNVRQNCRYQSAKKYIDNDGDQYQCLTKLMKDEKGIYIQTEHNTAEMLEIWETFEYLYSNGEYEKLVNLWYQSQSLTRSTCLIGCMLIMLFEGCEIEFINDELPDWKSIIKGTYKGTYKTLSPLLSPFECETYKCLTLSDVLKILSTYMCNILKL